jgi:hypothetical protein
VSLRVEPMINFAAHEVRAGKGAWADFEGMLGLLVGATEKTQAHLVFGNPGDWGIDVMVGRLDHDVSLWQAKYFRQGVGKSEQSRIRESFTSALSNSQKQGYVLRTWVLCIPCSLDAPMTKWWAGFKRRRSDTGVQIELWDENRLRELLLRDAAVHIRRAYYDPYRETFRPDTYVPNTRRSRRQPLMGTWRAGDERIFHDSRYLLHEVPSQRHTADRSLIQRDSEATDLRDGQRVWIRQAQSERRTSAALAVRQALRMQAALDLLSSVVELIDEDDATTLITEHPDGTSWEETFGAVPVEPLTALAVLDAGADVCQVLGRLHSRGYDHRRIDPTTVVVGAGGARLRDAGLMAVPASPLDASTGSRAPEQGRAPYTAGPHTDVYQLAALVQRTLTGHLPRPSMPIPLPVFVPGFPDTAAAVITQALSVDPQARPNVHVLGMELRRARSAMNTAARP